MTLSSSMANALSGLTAASRAVDVVSSNVANAMTDGYARRELSLSARQSGGVIIDGVSRAVDDRVTSDRREAEAGLSNAGLLADAWLGIEEAIGYPTENGSLADRIDQLDTALISAASRPDETVRLDQAVSAAVSVADQINSVASDVQTLRQQADTEIATMVGQLNGYLDQVEDLNRQIARAATSDRDASALLDQRQAIVDSISEIVPVRQASRVNGQVALYTYGGVGLVDGQAATVAFQRSAQITPFDSYEAGDLSGISVNGFQLSIGGSYNQISGGKLSAAFEIRDQIAPGAQSTIDALARDLIERFQDGTLDTSLTAGDAGLFTDLGAAFDPTHETNVASRLRVNAAVNPEAGGDSWRLRDGLGATSAGPVGDSSLLSALEMRLTERGVVRSGPSAGLPRSVADLVSDFLSEAEAKYQISDGEKAFQSAKVDTLTTKELENGVDTDDEMQKLLLIEQAYAANARVVQTIDTLIQQILEI
ncbi:flagellar hook-associated protein FlgK [Tropicimonas sp. IMCC34043]|uniref:flagellar hook-associated protein FlgK n=1 Tax=Tropicimonas sp. IMCC34043 TaxID=2248760 RepID=UPI000E24D353|nr:flagellar hook-associated protein FlgK [Tropicimonas sp. IMCC34043]